MKNAARAWAVCVLLVSALFALSYGLRYGVHNQHTYLLRGARRADPTLFARDWLVVQATDYHPAFTVLVGWLMASGRAAWAVALANVAVLLAAALLFHLLARGVAGARGPAVFLLLVGWTVFAAQHEVTGSVAVSSLFTNYFIPANLGSLGLLAAVLFHIQGRFFLSGLAAAVGGLFHANFLVLAPPLFVLAHLVVRPPAWPRVLLAQLGPCAPVLLLRLPQLLAVGQDLHLAEGRRIFMAIRSPHHYLPLTFLRDFAPFCGWMLLGAVALWAAARPATGEELPRERLRALFLSVFAMVAVATLLTTVVYVPAVAQLFVFRLAPFGLLLAQLAFFSWVSSPEPFGAVPAWWRHVVAMVLAAVAVLAIAWRSEPRLGVALALAASIAVMPAARGTRAQVMAAALGILLLAFGSSRGLTGIGAEAAALDVPLSDEEKLYGWARTTPKDTLFAIPPDVHGFRLSAERAIVVDWKSTPVLASEVQEWYRRLVLESARPAIASLDDAAQGYRTMGPRRVARLRSELGVDFVVLRQPFPRTRLPELRVAFADRRFIVFDARTTAPVP